MCVVDGECQNVESLIVNTTTVCHFSNIYNKSNGTEKYRGIICDR